MMLYRSAFRTLLFAALLTVSALPVKAQDASQLGFTSLQTQANALVEQGKLVEALPLLKELVQRVEASDNAQIELDFPLFLIGTGHIQQYVLSKQEGELNEALNWYQKLEDDFPTSPKLKDMLLKRIDVYRALRRNEDAIAQMEKILSGGYPGLRLVFSEQTKILKDLTQIYYGTGQLAKGLPYFGQLMETSRDPEEQALAGAASFEALFEAKRMDDAIRLLPLLARESSVRYRPRLNVALLKASDALVAEGRVNDAALTLNLIKTTDLMIEFHEQQIAEKKARIELRQALGNAADDQIAQLEQEIANLEATLTELRKLPTLRNELLVRRARNYTKTSRRFEAFWMFYDLMEENPNDTQAEFYHYATFSNALQIGKKETAIDVAITYRSKFPQGDYYSDVSGALAPLLLELGRNDEFLQLAVDFLGTRPQDPVSPSLFAQWAAYLIENGEYVALIKQAAEWYKAHRNSIYEDGIFYWGGLAELQLSQFEDAANSFSMLLEKYPTSVYAEDGLLRKGASLFYAQRFEEARDSLTEYTEKYPAGNSLDQAFFFLGEIEYLAGDYELALQHFRKADSLTSSQDVHDAAAFKIGAVLEETARYDEMAAHFEAYIDRFGEAGDLTRAVLQLGRALEYLLRPVDMLALYRENIEKYSKDSTNTGVDALIESYAEKYVANQTMLTSTVALFDKLEEDLEYREQFVTDRGFLFEQFYNDQTIDQALYNRLRKDTDFTSDLLENLAPIEDLMAPYREQLAQYPSESPEDYYRDQLAKARAAGDFIAETRMLMGLYRLDVELSPSKSFDRDIIATLTPRAVLYVADYERNKRLPLAEEAWNWLLTNYPTDDATIVAFMRLADVTAEKGDRPGALDYLEQLVTQFPGSPKAPAVMLRQGELLSEMGQAQKAREKYQYILRVPEWRGVLHARALYQTGQSYVAESNFAAAHGFFERTFLGYPHLAEWSARAYLADADALIGMGAKADAVTTLNEAVTELTGKAPEELLQELQAKLRELQS